MSYLANIPQTPNIFTDSGPPIDPFCSYRPFLTFLDIFSDNFRLYRHGLIVLTIPLVFPQTDGIVSELLDHTRTRGPSVARMRGFFLCTIFVLSIVYLSKFLHNMKRKKSK